MLSALLVGFTVVFVAELGDKSQLMAMTFAVRYRWWVVLAAITCATALIQAVSVVVGSALGEAIPAGVIPVVAGLTMLAFAFWTLRGEAPADEVDQAESAASRSAFLVITSSFLLAELGDRTMLATVALATAHDPVGIWIGSTAGMVLAGVLAIAVGAVAGHRIRERTLSIAATLLFFGFAAWTLTEAFLGLHSARAVAGVAAAVALVCAAGLVAVRRARRARADAALTSAGRDGNPRSLV